MNNSRKERKYTIEDLEELLDNIPYEVWIKDKYGRHKYINKVSAERMGLKKEDIIGKTDYDFRPTEMAESCVKGDKSVLSTGKSSFVEDEIMVDDELKWFEIYKTLLYKNDENKKLLAGIAKYSNIKMSKQESIIESYLDAANSYKENNNDMECKILEGLKEIIRADDVALYSYNKENSMMELKIHIGINKVIFVQKNKFIDELDSAYFKNDVIEEELGEESIKYIYLIKSKNKSLGLLQIYFKNKPEYLQEDIIKYTYLILAFIQENRNLGSNLKKELTIKKDTQRKLEMVINTVIDFYAIAEKINDDLRFIEVNKKCSEILGWTCEEINSKGVVYYIHKNDKSRIKSFIAGDFPEMQGISCKVLCKDEKYKIFTFNWRCIEDNIYIITAEDVTKINELKEVKESLEQAIEIKKLKTEFFANLSHEFKTPLNIILSVVQVMSSSINNKNEVFYENFNRYIKSIKQNSYRLLRLANNMIDLSKIDDGFYDINMDNYNIVEIVENIVQSVAEYIKNNKRNIIFDTIEEQIITACAPNEIEKIILNLLSNSLKFTSDNGNIFVNIDISDDCSKVIIRVRNDGPALNKEDAEKIFERFKQSENFLTRNVEGSGIGLALVKSLVKLHNGRIYVNTEIREGTEFCIELPIRKIMNCNSESVLEKNLNSKVERFSIEFSDIYDLN